MAKHVKWFMIVVVTALFQTTWPEVLRFQEVQPDLCLLLVVYFAIVEGEERAMWTGVIGGIYQDVASTAMLGHHVLCLVIVGYTVGRLSTRLITEHPAVKAGLVFLAGFAHGLLYCAILYVQKPDTGFIYPVMTSVVPAAFYTAVVTPVAFFVLSWFFWREQSPQGGLI